MVPPSMRLIALSRLADAIQYHAIAAKILQFADAEQSAMHLRAVSTLHRQIGEALAEAEREAEREAA